MGCASSKRIEVTTADVYRPAPTSFAVFDINAIEEPWLKVDNTTPHQQDDDDEKKSTHVPAPILEKLNKFELVPGAPQSWNEVSKALEDLKPALQSKKNDAVATATSAKPEAVHPLAQDSAPPKKETPRRSVSFRTLEELDAKLTSKPTPELRKSESMKTTEFKKPELKKTESKKDESRLGVAVQGTETDQVIIKPVKENMFIVRDKLEREREGKEAFVEKLLTSRRDPLREYPEKCPPGGADSVVLYTTSLGGVRRTYEDCNRARSILEWHRVVFDERDVSLHGEFLNEFKELLGEGASVPRLFVKGRYLGGAEEVVELNEAGRLGRMLSWARVERGVGRQACEGCGGARFVPCLDCGGSCKVVLSDGKKERCPKCNENGLVHCPACI